MRYTLSIPVNKYQLSILTKELGSNPWLLDTKTWYGKILMNYMDKSRRIPHPSTPSPTNFVIELPPWFIKNYGLNYINPENVTEFIDAADREFRRGLLRTWRRLLLYVINLVRERSKHLA